MALSSIVDDGDDGHSKVMRPCGCSGMEGTGRGGATTSGPGTARIRGRK
jgi:hypothetical protein